MNKIKHFSLMLLTLVMAMGLNACSDDNDNNEVAGTNVVGTWYIIGDGFDKDNQVTDIYDIKADGTIIESANVYCSCNHTYTNGTVDCSRDHFKEEQRYTWQIKDGYFYLSGVGLAILSKKSNDEFTVKHPFYYDETLTLKRIKKFTK